MGKFIDAVGGGVVGAGLGLLLEDHNDRRQLDQQKKLQDMQIGGQKDLADYQQRQQMEMWNATNYGAQIKHMKEAGLNPALMYGMGGGGGQTTGGAGQGQVSGGGAPNGGHEVQGMGLQGAMMAAQIENIKADTENKRADAEYKGGAQTDLTKEDYENRKFDTLTNKEKWTEQIAKSQYENRTLEDRIKLKRLEVAGQEIANEAAGVGIKVDKARIVQMGEQVAQGWEALSQGEQRIRLEKFRTEIEANYPGITKVLGRITDDGLETLFNLRRSGGRQQMKGVD